VLKLGEIIDIKVTEFDLQYLLLSI